MIEVLAAAVPVDSIFLGKLFAMLAMSLVGISVWLTAGAIGAAVFLDQGLGSLPPPAVGWPAFIALAFVYFATNYLLIGSVFLGIGAQASTVREVQTLSMPVTMAQVLLFGFATLGRRPAEQRRGDRRGDLPVVLALRDDRARGRGSRAVAAPRGACLADRCGSSLILRLSAKLFRRSVLKSGPAFRWPWQGKAAA